MQAEALRAASQFSRAAELYQRALKYDPENARAKYGLSQLEADERDRGRISQADELAKAGKYKEAEDALRPVLARNPGQRDAQRLMRQIEEKTARPAVPTHLKFAETKPISIELQDVGLRAVFDVIGRATGVSFLFDKDLKADQRTSVAVRDARAEEVIRLVLASNQLDLKILNETTALVFPNTPQKQRDYQELVVKAFYLANADVKQTANMIRTILKTRDVFIDEKLGLLIMRDTPKAVRMAERLVAAQDIAEPEVMLEVEVLEVGANRLLDLGMKFPDTVAWSVQGAAGVPGQITLPEYLSRSSSLVNLKFNDPLFLLNLQQQDGSTNLLANPRIRVKNREKARIHIGDRVPVITTTAAVSGGFVSESVNYLDVGLKLEVEPTIYLEDEVGINMGLEVSNIVSQINGSSGTILAYQIGTRNTNTVLRLHDGETQVLAGLISDEDRRTASRVPGLGDMPVIGHLFSQTNKNRVKTEIVLLITPHVVRTLKRPEVHVTEFSSGTEASFEGAMPAGVGPAPPAPAPEPQPSPAPAAPAPYAPPAAPSGQPGALPMVPLGGVR
jgi:general secretion pathway protein D